MASDSTDTLFGFILFILFLPNGLESLIPKVKDWFAGGKQKPAKAERPAEAEQPAK